MDKRKLVYLLVAVSFLLPILLVVSPVSATETDYITATSTIRDGMVWKTSSTYSTVQSYPTGNVDDTGSIFGVGQLKSSVYVIYRGFVYFDTSGIAGIATIINATLSLYVTHDESDFEFNVTIQDGQPTYPHDTLETGDYYYDHYSGDGGSRITNDSLSEDAYWDIELNEDGLDMIQLDGITKLCLRSDREIAATQPVANEYVEFSTSEYDYPPQLTIYYSMESEDYYQYTFYGGFNEETGLPLNENITVDAYNFESGSPEQFILNGSETYYTYLMVQYFRFTFEDNSSREYWVDPSESAWAIIYVFWGDTTTYTLNFVDNTGILETYPYVTINRYINGTLHTVEKRKADNYGSIIANLIPERTYSIYLGNEDVTYVFGDLTVTSSLTTIQLMIRGIDFQKSTLLKENLRVYVSRGSNGTAISIGYYDFNYKTTSITVKLYDEDGDLQYSNTFYSYYLTLSLTELDGETAYLVDLDISHVVYGTLDFKQYLLGEVEPVLFDLSFLGDWGFDSYMLLPSLLVLCVAGCFSKLNAYVGAILMCVAAGILSAIGWFPIPAGMLVVAFSLAILMGLLYTKRGIKTQ